MNSTLRSLAATAAAAALLALTACSPSGGAASGVAGTWGEPDAQGEPSLEFVPGDDASSGDYSGTDGCNRVGGSYTVDGDEIDLGVMRATMMYCEGVDTWLVTATTATLKGDELTFADADGKRIGTLKRHDG